MRQDALAAISPNGHHQEDLLSAVRPVSLRSLLKTRGRRRRKDKVGLESHVPSRTVIVILSYSESAVTVTTRAKKSYDETTALWTPACHSNETERKSEAFFFLFLLPNRAHPPLARTLNYYARRMDERKIFSALHVRLSVLSPSLSDSPEPNELPPRHISLLARACFDKYFGMRRKTRDPL